MIQMQTSLEVADNSGARRVEMIMPIGGSTGKIASLGDRIKVTVKEASPDGTKFDYGARPQIPKATKVGELRKLQ